MTHRLNRRQLGELFRDEMQPRTRKEQFNGNEK